MNTLTDFPVKHIEKNLAFGRNGSVWAYFKVDGILYEHRDHLQKVAPFNHQMGFLTKNRGDLHFLVVPYRMDGLDVVDETLEAIKGKDYPLQRHGVHYQENVRRVVESNEINSDSTQYSQFIGVQLNPAQNRFKTGNHGAQLVQGLQAFLAGVNSPVRKMAGLDPYDISQTEIDAYMSQADLVGREVSAGYGGAVPLTTGEMVGVVEFGFTVSADNQLPTQEQIGKRIQAADGTEAVRPDQEFFYELQSAEYIPIDRDTTPHSIKLRKSVDGVIHEQLVQYLVVSDMEAANDHPGFEWLYHLQNGLPFPIGVSCRAYYKTNQKIKAELANVTLQFNEQHEQAGETGQRLGQHIEETEKGVRQLESRFQGNGHPGYSCSFVIRVAADTPQELSRRVGEVKRQLQHFHIDTQSPYGDTLKYFMEFVPTAARVSHDYWMHVEPGVLAGMLFGASTNIGDNKGFLIGFTKNLRKPVFIQPDLAAQSGTETLFDSLSIEVVGETGKGKSVFMNQFSALSALTNGSQVLVIDPKGDRKGWAEGLPFIPKEFIDVWTLGESKEDAGALDPFRTTANLSDAESVAMDILSYLTNSDLESIKYNLLSEAVTYAAKQLDPCLGVVLEYLETQYKNPPELFSDAKRTELENLLNGLQTIQKNQLANLLFGEVGQQHRSLDVTKQVQVVMVQNLILPKGEKAKLRAAEKISEAILLSLTAFTKRFIFKTERNRHKVILQDEAKTIENSVMGRELMDWIERNGRYYNATLMKGSQRATDFPSAANIGMKFAFMQREKEDARRMLEDFNLPVTPSNIKTLMELGRGECLFQDIYGRSALIYINVIFEEFLKAFDTSTDKDEAKEKVGV